MTHFPCKAAKRFLITAASALILAGFAHAEESVIAAGVTTGSGLRLRTEPSTNSSVITTLKNNTALDILDNSNEKWTKVSYQGQVGYVAASYVETLETFTNTPANDYASLDNAELSFPGAPLEDNSFPGAPLSAEQAALVNAFGEPVPAENTDYPSDTPVSTAAVNAFGEPVPLEDAFTGEISEIPYTSAAQVNAFGEPVPEEDEFDLPLPDDAFLEEDFLNADVTNLAIGVGIISGERVQLWSEPWEGSDAVATLASNSAAALLDDSLDGWLKISCGGYVGYVPSYVFQYVDSNSIETYARVNLDGVTIHDAAFGESTILQTLNKDETVGVVSLEDGWYFAVSSGGAAAGYIRSDLLNLGSSVSSKSNTIIETAKQYLNVRYVYGGTTPRGFDCSGFTQYVFRQCGISIPRTASTQWNSGLGTKITNRADLQPGDLVFFNDPRRNLGRACSHCGIYIGDGQFIHASSSSGVKISFLSESYYKRYFKGGLHIDL